MKAEIFFVVDYGNEERREFAESEKDAATEFFTRRKMNSVYSVTLHREIRFSSFEVIETTYDSRYHGER